MFEIVRRETFSPVTYLWEVKAPEVAKASQPGQFVMLRVKKGGERIPLTIADFDREKGTITLVVQAIGKTTSEMMVEMGVGDEILDFIGPLGIPSNIEKKDGKVVLVGGGLGVAPVFPQLRKYKETGNHTISIVGFRTKELMFWEDRFKKYSDEFYVATDDGSYGTKGFVTTVLEKILEENDDIAEVVAIGPLVMMRACAQLTEKYDVPTVVSLNTIMVDGIGMCGSCRVTVNDEVKFACVDGPDFDAHGIDWEEVINRNSRFKCKEDEEMECFTKECRAYQKYMSEQEGEQ